MEPFIGQIIMFGGNFAPRGWALCDGQLLPISQYSALFSILGTTYGGDGRTTFGLPELRGRVPMHPGHGPGLDDRRLGEKSGNEDTILGINNMPSHNHVARATTVDGDSTSPANALWADDLGVSSATYNSNANVTADTTMRAEAIGNTGGGQAFTNLQPYLAVNFIIALQGTYPSRS